MKKLLFFIVALLMLTFSSEAFAQGEADAVLGTYKAVQNGANSKVRISKTPEGKYTAQVFWVEELKDKNGNIKTDVKNPDAALRKVPVDQIVLIKEISYAGKGVWKNGKIYDPTRGKSFTVEVTFKDAKTLQVKGSLGPFSQKVYWEKLD